MLFVYIVGRVSEPHENKNKSAKLKSTVLEQKIAFQQFME